MGDPGCHKPLAGKRALLEIVGCTDIKLEAKSLDLGSPLSITITGMPASTAAFTDFSSAVASGIDTTRPLTFWVTAASIMRDIATMSVVGGA
jgi:hypothetical protein